MEHDANPDHDTLNEALRRCGATWDAAQAHGLLSGRLAVAGAAGGMEWMQQVLEGTDSADVLRGECERLLDALYKSTYGQLAQRLSEFAPLLPDDSETATVRATAMGHWCEGFLHGLVAGEHDDALKRKLSAEPLADIIKDLLQITRAAVDEDTDDETNEVAYAELVEYLRVAAQLAYEELAELRNPAGDAGAGAGETLH